jgi:hypothetical protein
MELANECHSSFDTWQTVNHCPWLRWNLFHGPVVDGHDYERVLGWWRNMGNTY